MDDDPRYFQHCLGQLADPQQKVKLRDLTSLSHLEGERLGAFAGRWRQVGAERRCWVVRQLIELAEGDVTLDFNAVFLNCLGDEDAQVRATAIQGLWEYHGHDLVERLKRLLAEEPEPAVRAEAALALGRFVLLAEYGQLPQDEGERVLRALHSAIADPREATLVRARAMEALGACSQAWVKEIIGGAYRSADQRLRLSAIHAMGCNCDSVWLPILLRELESADPASRFEAAAACGAIGDEEAVPYLARLLDDEDREAQTAAIAALGQIGGSEAKAVLLERLRQSEESLRELLEEALAESSSVSDPLDFRYRL